jgi:hypothetical protein
MTCPHCESAATREWPNRTELATAVSAVADVSAVSMNGQGQLTIVSNIPPMVVF